MEDGLTFFFDSYALIEIYKENKNYEKYKFAKVKTTYLHLYESYYNLRKYNSEEECKDFFELVKQFCIPLKFEWMKESVSFRLANKKKDLSYADCLGYIISKDLKIKFLTGDNQFKDLPNVEFVK